MEVQVTFRHTTPTDALREAAEARVDHITRLFGKPDRASVILSVEKHEQKAEILMHGDGFEIVAHASTDDLYKSLDEAAHKAEGQAKRLHEKREAKRREV